MAMRAVVGAAVFEDRMRIDDVEQVAQDLIGFIVEVRLARGQALQVAKFLPCGWFRPDRGSTRCQITCRFGWRP